MGAADDRLGKGAASAMPFTTVAGPRVASPAAYTPSTLVWKAGRPSCPPPCRWRPGGRRPPARPRRRSPGRRGCQELTGAHGAAAAGGIGLAQHHLLAAQHTVSCSTGAPARQRSRRRPAPAPTHARRRAYTSWCGDRRGDVLWRRCAWPDGPHPWRVAGAHHGHIAAHGDVPGLDALHPLDGAGHIAGDVQLAGLPCAHGIEDMGVAHGLQLVHGGGGRAAANLPRRTSPSGAMSFSMASLVMRKAGIT